MESDIKNHKSRFEPIRLPIAPSRLALLAMLLLVVTAGRTASALTINLSYDTDANLMAAGLSAADITSMKAACNYAAKQLTDRYTDPVNVNIMVTATPGTNDFGSSTTFFAPVDNYNNLRAAFVSDSKTADDATTIGTGGSLPAGGHATSRGLGKDGSPARSRN